jgi:hypothetical protein
MPIGKCDQRLGSSSCAPSDAGEELADVLMTRYELTTKKIARAGQFQNAQTKCRISGNPRLCVWSRAIT